MPYEIVVRRVMICAGNLRKEICKELGVPVAGSGWRTLAELNAVLEERQNSVFVCDLSEVGVGCAEVLHEKSRSGSLAVLFLAIAEDVGEIEELTTNRFSAVAYDIQEVSPLVRILWRRLFAGVGLDLLSNVEWEPQVGFTGVHGRYDAKIVARFYGLSLRAMAKLLGLSHGALYACSDSKQSHEKLRPFVMMARVARILRDRLVFLQWLQEPLGDGTRPIDLLSANRLADVDRLVKQMADVPRVQLPVLENSGERLVFQ